MTLSALTSDFLKYLELERHVSHLTIKNYDHYLKSFLEFARPSLDPKEIDLNLVRKYKLHLLKKPLKRITQNFFLIALRSFLRFLERKGVDSLYYKKVELREVEPRPIKVLDKEQLISLLNAPDTGKKEGLRDRAVLETIYSNGLRVSQLILLNRDQVKSLSIPGEWPEKYLSARRDSFKPLFIRFQGKIDPTNSGEAMRLSSRSIERIVEKYVKKLMLSVKATPHTLRLKFISSQV